MKYDFSNMKGKARKLYTKMWGGTGFSSDDFITNKNWTGVATNASFYIKTPNASQSVDNDNVIAAIAEDLASKFDVACKNKDVFKAKLKQACSGSGQEAMKITTMHSSSLCALLFFYNVCEGNELVLSLGNNAHKNTYVFNFSNFNFPCKTEIFIFLFGVKNLPPTLFLQSFMISSICTFSISFALPKVFVIYFMINLF